MNQATFQSRLYVDYSIQYPMAGSSTKEPDINEVIDNLFSIPDQRKLLTRIFHQNLLSLFEIDLSSVQPHFEMRREPLLIETEKISEEMIAAEMLVHDFTVRIPPKRYRVEIEVRSKKRGEPTIVVPEEFL
ncbi:MAG: hypothetical protein AB1665_03075 [Candidatus Thermoplasmatota archaeon]